MFLFATEAISSDNTDYQKLEHKIKKLEVQAYQASLVNAKAIEMLCRETHQGDYCLEMYKKAAKNAKPIVDEYMKEVFLKK